MEELILVLNAGSSSLKFAVYRRAAMRHEENSAPVLVLRGQFERLGLAPHLAIRSTDDTILCEGSWQECFGHDRAIALLFLLLEKQAGDAAASEFESCAWFIAPPAALLPASVICAVGHRIVHGGRTFSAPVRIDDEVLQALTRLIPLAPLHQPHNLAPVLALKKVHEKMQDMRGSSATPLLQVACFDTAFHHDQPAVEQAYALPERFTALGVHRYGFHGLSYEYIAARLREVDAAAAAGRTVVMHLGNGASLCALAGGRSIASTMGFTALDGLPMGTRSGSLDPGVLLYLLDELRMDARAIEHLLYHESGLLGVSGISSDMRVLEASLDPRASAAIALFTYRIGRELGSAAAALGGLDAIVFTAGIGEHSARVRRDVCRGAAWLGVTLDEDANARANAHNTRSGPRISAPGSRVRAWVIPTDEEAMIAQHVAALNRL